MDDATQLTEPSETLPPADAPLIPLEPAVPISSRFLFVDVAALRAKQLRRGAGVRFQPDQGPMPIKPERVAMEEVRRCLVPYSVPIWRKGARVVETEPEA